MYFFYSIASAVRDSAPNPSPSQESVHDLGQGYFTTPAFKLLLHLFQIINILVVPGRLKVN